MRVEQALKPVGGGLDQGLAGESACSTDGAPGFTGEENRCPECHPRIA